MYHSLSTIDDAEVRRQELLADAALRLHDEMHRAPVRGLSMPSLVNASYGIAMGQRPAAPSAAAREPSSRIGRSSQDREPNTLPVGGHRARHVLRTLAAIIANIRRPRGLTGPSPR